MKKGTRMKLSSKAQQDSKKNSKRASKRIENNIRTTPVSEESQKSESKEMSPVWNASSAPSTPPPLDLTALPVASQKPEFETSSPPTTPTARDPKTLPAAEKPESKEMPPAPILQEIKVPELEPQKKPSISFFADKTKMSIGGGILGAGLGVGISYAVPAQVLAQISLGCHPALGIAILATVLAALLSMAAYGISQYASKAPNQDNPEPAFTLAPY